MLSLSCVFDGFDREVQEMTIVSHLSVFFLFVKTIRINVAPCVLDLANIATSELGN